MAGEAVEVGTGAGAVEGVPWEPRRVELLVFAGTGSGRVSVAIGEGRVTAGVSAGAVVSIEDGVAVVVTTDAAGATGSVVFPADCSAAASGEDPQAARDITRNDRTPAVRARSKIICFIVDYSRPRWLGPKTISPP